jgi:hypothetical protein
MTMEGTDHCTMQTKRDLHQISAGRWYGQIIDHLAGREKVLTQVRATSQGDDAEDISQD